MSPARPFSKRPSVWPGTYAQASPDDIVKGDGGLHVAGVPANVLSWGELAQAAKDDARRPADMAAGLSHELDFDGTDSTFPFGTHVSLVEVDTDTGEVTLLRHVAVDDCGRILNPCSFAGSSTAALPRESLRPSSNRSNTTTQPTRSRPISSTTPCLLQPR
ncbi:MAG: molybdopterin cofactor-binding domain-containing protein [Acidimicrobiales bacterium]